MTINILAMHDLIKLKDYSVIYISYDEPNAEENWNNIKSLIPTAKRVHGVQGIAHAHMAAAKLSTTERTITIDGDNFLFSDFINHEFEIDNADFSEHTLINWPGKNSINGLKYGNGGIKLWPTHILADRKTNELAPDNDPKRTDYCLGLHSQITFRKCFAETRINASPLQAWRAGFREGVKLGLDKGKRNNIANAWPGGLARLTIWMSIGLDVTNGIWAILGAREGCYLTHFTDWNIDLVSNYQWLTNYFFDNNAFLTYTEILQKCKKMESKISSLFNIVEVFSDSHSSYLKTLNINLDEKPSYNQEGYYWVDLST